MLNREYIKEVLPVLVCSSMPKNARRFSYQVIDFSRNFNVFGFQMDPVPFEGKVVAYDEDQQLMVIKKGRKSEYRVVDLDYVTQKPAIGKKVKITPYARRDWNGDRLDKPTLTKEISSDGTPYTATTTLLGGKMLKLPTPEISNHELCELIRQIELLPAPDGIRNISHMLADANATQFEVNEQNSSISFHVNTQKHQGKVEIVYDRASDLYTIFLLNDEIVVSEDDGVYFDQLGDILSDRIDDLEWKKIKVEVI